MLGSFISKVADLQKQVEASFEEALHYDPADEEATKDQQDQEEQRQEEETRDDATAIPKVEPKTAGGSAPPPSIGKAQEKQKESFANQVDDADDFFNDLLQETPALKPDGRKDAVQPDMKATVVAAEALQDGILDSSEAFADAELPEEIFRLGELSLEEEEPAGGDDASRPSSPLHAGEEEEATLLKEDAALVQDAEVIEEEIPREAESSEEKGMEIATDSVQEKPTAEEVEGADLKPTDEEVEVAEIKPPQEEEAEVPSAEMKLLAKDETVASAEVSSLAQTEAGHASKQDEEEQNMKAGSEEKNEAFEKNNGQIEQMKDGSDDGHGDGLKKDEHTTHETIGDSIEQENESSKEIDDEDKEKEDEEANKKDEDQDKVQEEKEQAGREEEDVKDRELSKQETEGRCDEKAEEEDVEEKEHEAEAGEALGAAKEEAREEEEGPEESAPEAVSTFDAQVQTLRNFYAIHDPGKSAEQIRAIVVKRKGDAPALTGEAFDELCEQISAKYGEDPRRPGVPCQKRTLTPSTSGGTPALFGSWLQPSSGAQLLQTLQGAVDGIRENVERSIDEVRQSQADPAVRSPSASWSLTTELLQSRIQDNETELVSWGDDEKVAEDEDAPAERPHLQADAPQFQTPDGDSAEPEPPAPAAEAGSGEATERVEKVEEEEEAVNASVELEEPPAAAAPSTPTAEQQEEQGGVVCGRSPSSSSTGPTLAEEFERQVKVLQDFYAVYDPGRSVEQIRAILNTRKGDADALSKDHFEVLLDQIKAKYGVDPRRPNSPSAIAARELAEASKLSENSADSAEMFPSWLKSSTMSSSISGDGLLMSGLRTLQTLQSTAEGLRENVERSFEEAIRSQDDSSAFETMQGMREGWRDVVDKSATAIPAEPSSSSSAVPQIVPEEGEEMENSGVETSADLAAPQVNGVVDPNLQADRDRLARSLTTTKAQLEACSKELAGVKEEKKNLIAEGMRMSKRVHAVEERMKEAVGEARRMETRVGELEKIRDSLQSQVQKLMARADDAESLCNEQRGEIRRMTAELERSRGQLLGEQRRLEAEHHAHLQRSREIGDRSKQTQERLDAALRECSELRATNTSLTQELERARGAIDAVESQHQQQLQEAEQANELQRQRLEAVELEFASQSLPLTRRIADLETRLSKQEMQHGERLAAAQREADDAIRELATLREEMRGMRATQDKEQEVLREQARKGNTLVNEMSETLRLREAEEARAQRARESAERDRQVIEAELRLEKAKRQTEEQRSADLASKIGDLTQQLERAQAASKVAGLSASQARPAADTVGSSGAPGHSRELDAEARRLRMEVDGLAKQRELLERDNARLQSKLDSMAGQAGAQNGKPSAPNHQLSVRFEAALQAIGKLQEDLEACKDQRDAYKRQCHDLMQALGKDGR